MQTLLSLYVDEGGDRYRVALGVQSRRLVFQCEDREPEVLDGAGPLYVAWVLREDRQRVVYVGELDSDAERVELLATPSDKGLLYPILRSPSRWPRPFFMTGPLDFKRGTVTVRWQAKRRMRGWRTVYEQRVRLLQWGRFAA
jgi:hypothetical protein